MNKILLVLFTIVCSLNLISSNAYAYSLNSCYGDAKSDVKSCIMMFWGNSAGQSNCKEWQRGHQSACQKLYGNSKQISQKVANCINKANDKKLNCVLLNYGKPVGLQNCSRSKLRSVRDCFYINQ